MPDEPVPAEQETPSPEQAAPDTGTPAPEPTEGSQPESENWQERYANLQPEYTRATQEAAQYRQIIDLAKQGDPEALEYLGLEPADEDEEEEEEPEFRDPRVDELLQAERDRQEEADVNALETEVEGEIHKLAKAAGIEFEDDAQQRQFDNLVFGQLSQGQDGNPDVEGAFKAVTGYLDTHVKSYVAGKRRPPSAPSGSSPSHQPDLDNDEERQEYLLQRALNG